MPVWLPRVPWPQASLAIPMVEAVFDPNLSTSSTTYPSYSNLSEDCRNYEMLEQNWQAIWHRRLHGAHQYQTEFYIDRYHSGILELLRLNRNNSIVDSENHDNSLLSQGVNVGVALNVGSTTIEWWVKVGAGDWLAQTTLNKISTDFGLLRYRHYSPSNTFDEITLLAESNWTFAKYASSYLPMGWQGSSAKLMASRTNYAEATSLGSSYIDPSTATIEFAYFCDKYEATSNQRFIKLISTGTDWRFAQNFDSGTKEHFITFLYIRDGATSRVLSSQGSGISVDDGVLHRISVTFDSSTGANMYIDGTLVDTNTGGTGNWAANALNGIRIGHYSSSYDIRGFIGDMRIFDDVRTPSEITSGRNIGSVSAGTDNLTHLWACSQDDGGGTVSDQVGSVDLSLSTVRFEGYYFVDVPQPT